MKTLMQEDFQNCSERVRKDENSVIKVVVTILREISGSVSFTVIEFCTMYFDHIGPLNACSQ